MGVVGLILSDSAFLVKVAMVYILCSIGPVCQPSTPQIQERPPVSHPPIPADQSFPRIVREVPLTGSGTTTEAVDPGVPVWVHPEWREAFPWLCQGVTGRGGVGANSDFALFGSDPDPAAPARWESLAKAEGFLGIVHSRQVHGKTIRVHDGPPAGLYLVTADGDGHASKSPGVLMAVTVADCVPVFLVDPVRRVAVMIHAGWRSAAKGILEEGVGILRNRFESRASDIQLHLGPSICGECYEVGPEVHETFGLPRPAAPTPIDLRGILAQTGAAEGIPMSQISGSAFCTRCHNHRFYSHRRGDPERQVGFLGIREPQPAAGNLAG
jgi:YfiH family protein